MHRGVVHVFVYSGAEAHRLCFVGVLFVVKIQLPRGERYSARIYFIIGLYVVYSTSPMLLMYLNVVFIDNLAKNFSFSYVY